MEKIINDYGKEVYRDVNQNTQFCELEFHLVQNEIEDDVQYALHTNLGSLTVLDRITGFGYRDTETGFRDMDGKFWLASGDYDVRKSGAGTIQDAINWVKNRANNCIGL